MSALHLISCCILGVSGDVMYHLPAAKQGNSALDGGCEGGVEGVKKGRFRRVLELFLKLEIIQNIF